MKDIEETKRFTVDLEPDKYFLFEDGRLIIKCGVIATTLRGEEIDELREFLNYIKAKQQ